DRERGRPCCSGGAPPWGGRPSPPRPAAPGGRRLEGWEHVMDHVRRHRFLRCCLFAVPLLLVFALIAPPAGADADGYIDHFPGDVSFTPKIWNQTTGAYTPIPGQPVTVPSEL